MVRNLVYLALFILLNLRSFGLPIYKRSSRNDRARPVQGVEVSGLFNPMEGCSSLGETTNSPASVLNCSNELPKNMEIQSPPTAKCVCVFLSFSNFR